MADKPFRRGDAVTIRGVVKYDRGSSDGAVHIDLGDYNTAIVNRENVELLHHAFEVGDRVRVFSDSPAAHECTVQAQCGDQLWLKNDDGTFETLAARLAEHAPTPLKQAAERAMGDVKFTPGPWIADGPDWAGDYNILPTTDALAVGAVVANLRSAEEVRANAHLSAAAPELFEALKYARRFLKEDDHDVAFVDAALAKATGEAE